MTPRERMILALRKSIEVLSVMPDREVTETFNGGFPDVSVKVRYLGEHRVEAATAEPGEVRFSGETH